MAWTVTDTGSWALCVTDDPATELAAALALPGSWDLGPSMVGQVLVRRDQVVHLPGG